MNNLKNLEAKRVLAFDPRKRLIAIYHSAMDAAKSLDIHTQSVHYACTGRTISTKKMYLRHLSDEIEITIDDLGILKLEEYDELCGVERKVYKNTSMSRKGSKYKKKILCLKSLRVGR